MKIRRAALLTGIVLICTFSFTACSPVSKESAAVKETQTVDTNQETQADKQMTLGEAAEFMVETAAKYGNRLEKDALLKDLQERESEEADGLDMLVIVSRAFGTLPEPEESKKLKENVDISAVPEWAGKEIENLKNAGVLKQSDLDASEAAISKKQIEDLVQRVMDLYGN